MTLKMQVQNISCCNGSAFMNKLVAVDLAPGDDKAARDAKVDAALKAEGLEGHEVLLSPYYQADCEIIGGAVFSRSFNEVFGEPV